jgi:hypothetical protein
VHKSSADAMQAQKLQQTRLTLDTFGNQLASFFGHDSASVTVVAKMLRKRLKLACQVAQSGARKGYQTTPIEHSYKLQQDFSQNCISPKDDVNASSLQSLIILDVLAGLRRIGGGLSAAILGKKGTAFVNR